MKFSNNLNFLLLLLLYLLFPGRGYGQKTDLATLSLEELMKIEVITSSRKSVRISNVDAAISVITSSDIRESGATTVPEALRLIPGLQVARIDANKWAISSRGFNGVFANKLLVLIDGRSVYTPLFSGVFWDSQNIPLYDIDRIEIIRGPGATLWGANAVNGIINIITRDAKETTNQYVSLGIGTENNFLGNVRFGKSLTDNLHFRMHARYYSHDGFVDSNNVEQKDGWNVFRTGFRLDWDYSANTALMVQGDVYHENIGQLCRIIRSYKDTDFSNIDTTAQVTGANLLLRWEHIFSYTSDMAAQLYYDLYDRSDVILCGQFHTADFDFQHRFGISSRNEMIWGLGYRFMYDNSSGTIYVYLDPESRQTDIMSAFVQDEHTIIEDKMSLTIGAKFEHNYYTGLEIQPNIRLLYKASPLNTIWGAISKAVRTPSRVENDGRAIRNVWNLFGLPLFGQLHGTKSFGSEKLIAYEIGHRLSLKNISYDIALFYNKYDNLRSYKLGEMQHPPDAENYYIIIPMYLQNNMDGESFGGELSLKLKPFTWCQFQANYAYLKINVFIPTDGTLNVFDRELNKFAKGTEGESPENQINLRSTFRLLQKLDLSLSYRWIDKIPQLHVNSYSNLNVQLHYKVSDGINVNITGHNLLKSHYTEYIPAFIDIRNTDVERGVFAAIEYKF